MELLTVVAIVGMMAVLAVGSFRKRVSGSRTGEALAMVQAIRAAEERYKAENLRYLNVSSKDDWFPSKPTNKTRRSFYPAAHADLAKWKTLNPAVIGPSEFGYLVNAGPPSGAMTPPAEAVAGFAWPNNSEHWFVIQAIADGNGDGVHAFFLASSLKADVYRQNEGE